MPISYLGWVFVVVVVMVFEGFGVLFCLGMWGKDVLRVQKLISRSSKLMSQFKCNILPLSHNTGCRSYLWLTPLMKLHMLLLTFPQPNKLWHWSDFPGPEEMGEIPAFPVSPSLAFTKFPWWHLWKAYCNSKAWRQTCLNTVVRVEIFILHSISVTITYIALELKDFRNIRAPQAQHNLHIQQQMSVPD